MHKNDHNQCIYYRTVNSSRKNEDRARVEQKILETDALSAFDRDVIAFNYGNKERYE